MAFVRPTQTLRIGEYDLDPGLNELRRDGAVVRLPARLADLLLRLATEPGQLIRRETLIDEVWERRQVNDEVLSRAVADLRQFLGDEARAPRYIETLPKLGYRLVAEVRPVAAAVPQVDIADPTVAPATLLHLPRRRRRWVVLALAAGMLLVAVWQFRPTDSASHARIAPDPLTAANLLRARPFTTEPGRELFPRFTPDGRWVIYARAASDREPAVLRLRAVDGTEDRALVEDGLDNFCGTVSPDGATLTWLRTRPGVCELVYRPLLGGPARVLAGCEANGLANCPDWAPDGRTLVLNAAGKGATGLREIAFPAGAERTLTTPSTGIRDLMPRYTRDGRHVVFWRGDGWGRGLMQLDRASGIARSLRPQQYLAFGHANAIDGSVLLADDSFGQRALVRIPRDTLAAPSLLGGSDARYPDIASDGGLVYEVARYDANLWRVDLRDASVEPLRLTHSARYDSQPAVSPDGHWLAFGSNRDGREGVYLMRSDGRDERKLPFDPALRWTSPTWSPDGRTLLVLRYDPQGTRFCLHQIDSANTMCPDGLGADRHAGFFLDATKIAMIDLADEAPRLWQVGLDGSELRAATDEAVDRCRATKRWLACHRPGHAGLSLQDRRSGATRDILPVLDSDNLGAWALLDSAVYFAVREGLEGAPGIFRHDLQSDALRRVTTHMPSAIGDSISVTPDESWLVVARTDGLETDLMYVPPPGQ